ncbi:hypothetical protein DY000_02017426 [Brassica cretica]|uniref:Uncharacterized protein n=1 Tax=Brassica cretica TaxID=69181 RepID=A0ABQ7CVC8_BRACR|nr:hypothetical protein DY000_02017426 [Brassica cretica]
MNIALRLRTGFQEYEADSDLHLSETRLVDYEARGRQFTAVSRTSCASGTGTWWGRLGTFPKRFRDSGDGKGFWGHVARFWKRF